ncbi:MAG: pitrilysin family protein [Bacteroidota bacterium]
MLDRRSAPEVHKISDVNFQQSKEETLPNGALLALLESGEQEVVKVEVVFLNAGNKSEALKGQGSMAIRMLKEGTTSYSAAEITNRFSELGAYIEVNPGFDNSSVAIYCLDKHLKQLLPVFSEILQSPTFEEKELQLQKELQIAQLRVQNKKNNILASKGIRQAIFSPSNPYGRIISEADIQTIKPEHLLSFWNDSKNNFDVLVCGAPSNSSVDAIRDIFGSKMTYESKTFEAISISSEEQKSASNESIQASIRLGKRTLLKNDPDYIPLLITNHLLGGFFGSRLMKNIREDKGLTYGISSSLIPLQEDAYWVIGAEVNIDNVDLALKEIQTEIHRLSEFKSEEELETAKTHMMGSFQSELNSPFALMNRYKSVHLHGLDYTFYDQLFRTLSSFTSSDLRATAEKYLIRGSLEQVVIN